MAIMTLIEVQKSKKQQKANNSIYQMYINGSLAEVAGIGIKINYRKTCNTQEKSQKVEDLLLLILCQVNSLIIE